MDNPEYPRQLWNHYEWVLFDCLNESSFRSLSSWPIVCYPSLILTNVPHSSTTFHRNFGTRTTNHLEGWHNALNKRVKQPHCDIFTMIRHLKTDAYQFKNQRILLMAGNPPKPMLKEYRDLNERLLRTTQKYQSNEITLMQYLSSAAYNLHEHASTPQDNGAEGEPPSSSTP